MSLSPCSSLHPGADRNKQKKQNGSAWWLIILCPRALPFSGDEYLWEYHFFHDLQGMVVVVLRVGLRVAAGRVA